MHGLTELMPLARAKCLQHGRCSVVLSIVLYLMTSATGWFCICKRSTLLGIKLVVNYKKFFVIFYADGFRVHSLEINNEK